MAIRIASAADIDLWDIKSVSDQPKPATPPRGRVRYCWHCGENMGFIDSRIYDRRDTCGAAECEREARNADAGERHDAHEQLDRDRGWDR